MKTKMTQKVKFTRLSVLAAGVFAAGCSCVDVKQSERVRINQLHAQGISWKNERDAGRFTPPVNMTAAVFWSILPGAGQLFMEHKMSESGYLRLSDAVVDRRQLNVTGTLMLGTSWIPHVYCFTLPFGLASGTVVDVNRINNLALLEHLDRQAAMANDRE